MLISGAISHELRVQDPVSMRCASGLRFQCFAAIGLGFQTLEVAVRNLFLQTDQHSLQAEVSEKSALEKRQGSGMFWSNL